MEQLSTVNHPNEFQGVVKQLSTLKMAFDDEIKVLLLLSSLTDSWEILVFAVSNTATGGKVTMTQLRAVCLMNTPKLRLLPAIETASKRWTNRR